MRITTTRVSRIAGAAKHDRRALRFVTHTAPQHEERSKRATALAMTAIARVTQHSHRAREGRIIANQPNRLTHALIERARTALFARKLRRGAVHQERSKKRGKDE